ncbi:MAG: type II toxin-antitoxin system antitoxin SocA domain-containing protein [Cyclobacteriaceae bacterium]
MKSPITGKEMVMKQEIAKTEFRKERFEMVYHYYWCEDSGEKFEDERLTQLNLSQVYNQFRKEHNLPFPEEIIALREQYGLSPSKMSEVLGFGVNVYRNYENGEVPNSSNARLIQLAQDPKEFKRLIELSNALTEKERDRVMKKIEGLLIEHDFLNFDLTSYLMGDLTVDDQTGYRKPNLEKFTEMVVFFTIEAQPLLWKTKINKMLFYADFLNFRKEVNSISGCRYRAIDMGPVPNNFNSLFDYVATNNHIDIITTSFSNGSMGEQFMPTKERVFDETKLNPQEIETLRAVVAKFKKVKTNEIIELSHKEEAWEKNFKNGKRLISYIDAFKLVTI